MAASILVKDVLWRVALLLQDTAPQFQRWPERELVHWLNDGQASIAKYLPMACSRVDAIKLVAGTKQSLRSIPALSCKPGDGSTPSVPIAGMQFLNPRRNMGADGLTAGKAIRMVERDVLDSQDPDWHTRTASSVASVVYDPQTPRDFYVTPGVTGNVWIEVAYTAAPIAIPNTAAAGSEAYLVGGASTTTISIDDEFAPDLVDYIVARAHLKDVTYAEPAKAKAHTELFLASLNAKVAAVTGNNPNLTVLPGVSSPRQRQ
jgi:hypothetical protein